LKILNKNPLSPIGPHGGVIIDVPAEEEKIHDK